MQGLKTMQVFVNRQGTVKKQHVSSKSLVSELAH